MFEIADRNLKVASMTALVTQDGPPQMQVYEFRGQRTVIDSDLTIRFGTTTTYLNQVRRRNTRLFNDSHGFELNDDEFAALRLQIATPNPGRGGRRYPPFVFTARGVARIATLLNSDEAIAIADLIIDTFLTVQAQIAGGNTQVAIPNPSRYRSSEDIEAYRSFRTKLNTALSNLLDTVIDVQENKTVRETLSDTASSLLANVRERIREKGLQNEKLEADTALVLAQAEKVAAETRNLDADAEGKRLDNLDKKIAIVQRLLTLHKDMEGSEIIHLLGSLIIDLYTPPECANYFAAADYDATR